MSIPPPISGSSVKDYTPSTPCTWCEGCGNYGIWTALRRALAELCIPPHGVLLCFDIGCHGNMSDKILGYRFHGLHGRVIPLAAGAALANPRVPVIAIGGDGATFCEGIGHLVHAVRSNYDITFILHNNADFALTTGQATALTPKGQVMNTAPLGTVEEPLDSMDFVFSLRPTFVARGFSGDIAQLTEILKAAVAHRGFSYVDVLQACPTYNKFATHESFLERVYDVAGDQAYDPADFGRARRTASDTGGRIATGVLYRRAGVPTFYDELAPRRGIETTAVEEVSVRDIAGMLKKYA